MPFPNYANSIANLSHTLGQFLGHPADDRDLCLGPLQARLDPGKSTILLIIDGLSFDFINRYAGDSFFCKHLIAKIDSVFPSTTASAISTYMTGVSPKQHGLTGWFTYFQEIQQVVAILPYRTRGEWLDLQDTLGDSNMLFPQQNFFHHVERECHMVMPDGLLNSPYSRHFQTKDMNKVAFTGLQDMFDKLHTLQTPSNKFVYCYWPDFDALAHQFGVNSEENKEHFQKIDQQLKHFCDSLENCQLVICADHGFIDTEAHKVVYIDEHPELHECLAQPLCGEPRTVFCYVKEEKRRDFEKYVNTKLQSLCQCVPSTSLLEQGHFGKGQHHQQLPHRIGTYTLLMKDNYVMVEQLEGENAFSMIGVHGGISEQEMQVPLFYFSN